MNINTIDEFEFIDLLKKEDIDFVATVTTHWHAIGLDAFLYQYFTNFEDLNGVILITPHPNDGYIINEKDFYCNNFIKLRFYYVHLDFVYRFDRYSNLFIKSAAFFYSNFVSVLNKLRFYNKNNHKILFINPWFPPTVLVRDIFLHKSLYDRYSPQLILTDEGTATYISDDAFKLNFRNSFFGVIRLFFSKILSWFEYKTLLKDVPIENRAIFQKFNQNSDNLKMKFIINDDVVDSYKQILKVRRTDLNLTENDIILLVTNAHFEESQCFLEDELKLIDLLVQFLIKHNYYIVLKPHPREIEGKYDKIRERYNIQIIPQDFPVEELFSQLNPVCVISTLSTALINANLFFDFKCISVVDMLISMTNSDIIKINADEFKNLAGDMISYPSDFKELKCLLFDH